MCPTDPLLSHISSKRNTYHISTYSQLLTKLLYSIILAVCRTFVITYLKIARINIAQFPYQTSVQKVILKILLLLRELNQKFLSEYIQQVSLTIIFRIFLPSLTNSTTAFHTEYMYIGIPASSVYAYSGHCDRCNGLMVYARLWLQRSNLV